MSSQVMIVMIFRLRHDQEISFVCSTLRTRMVRLVNGTIQQIFCSEKIIKLIAAELTSRRQQTNDIFDSRFQDGRF